VHSTGHPSRLHRFEIRGRTLKEDYSKEELVAELGASFLSAHCSLDVEIKESADYIGGWIKILKGDSSLIVRAASCAQKAVDLIRGVSFEEDEK